MEIVAGHLAIHLRYCSFKFKGAPKDLLWSVIPVSQNITSSISFLSASSFSFTPIILPASWLFYLSVSSCYFNPTTSFSKPRHSYRPSPLLVAPPAATDQDDYALSTSTCSSALALMTVRFASCSSSTCTLLSIFTSSSSLNSVSLSLRS